MFWQQVLVNGTWSAVPTNLVKALDHVTVSNYSPTESKILTALGLNFLLWIPYAKTSFIIPPDNDDSSVNLALLAFLKETNSSHYSFWNSLNYKKN